MEWAKIDDKTYQYDEGGVRFFLLLGEHPHVFGDMKYASEEELCEAWNEIKKEEKAGKE